MLWMLSCWLSVPLSEPGISWYRQAQSLAISNPAGTCQPVHITVTQQVQGHSMASPRSPQGPRLWRWGLWGCPRGRTGAYGTPQQLTHLEVPTAHVPAAQVICKQKRDLLSNNKHLLNTYYV